MARIIVLGAGMVGRAMALDLARRHEVTAADRDEAALAVLARSGRVATVRLDFGDRRGVAQAVAGFDLVVGAVPGFLGYDTLATLIEAGKDTVDISFCPEDPLDLDALAREQGVRVLVDMGVAPGMDHVLLGHHDASMRVESFECLVGGLPRTRTWPFDYKASFSPIDVIEEYTRPARYVANGRLVTQPPLSDPELVEFEGVGTLEAFNTDGLRTLLTTMPHLRDMKEKTLRYPGHVRLIQALRAAGFLSTEPLAVAGAQITPLEFTSRVLIDAWSLDPGEEEFTVMRVTISGSESGRTRTYVYHLFDSYDAETGTSSMARTTGYTCTAAAGLLLEGLFTEKGVFPPERVGRDRACFDHLLSYLARRGIRYRAEEQA